MIAAPILAGRVALQGKEAVAALARTTATLGGTAKTCREDALMVVVATNDDNMSR